MTSGPYARRRAIVLSIGLIAATALTACAPGAQNAGKSAEQNGDGALTVWHYYGGGATAPFESLLAKYTDETGVEVTPRLIPFGDFNRTLLQSATAGDLPDVALVNAFDTALFADAGMIIDLSEQVEKWGEKDQYFDGSWATTQFDGATYGIPHVADTYSLWYNETRLEEANTEVPTTWDETEATAKALSDGQNFGLVYAGIEGAEGSTAFILRFLAAGGDITKIDGPEGLAAMESFARMNDEKSTSPGVLTWNEDDTTLQFQNETAAMMINSASYMTAVSEESDATWNIAPMPEDAVQTSFLSAENLTITKDSANVDAAWDLVEWMQQPDVMNEYLPERNKLPVREDTASDEQWSDAKVQTFINQLDVAWAPDEKVAPKSAEIFTAIQNALQAVLSGQSDPQTALTDAQLVIDKALG
ncbi:sugar ABC transporter substrate-binding protein [Mycetocola miduiensis]|nr:sugar ABC transporter substrate-binding protein [Mycetocola miduiensis]